MKYINDMMKLIREIAGSHSEYTVFADWVNMLAVSMRNACALAHDDIWLKYEDEYAGLASKYKDPDRFSELSGLLIMELEREPRDVLGELFMAAGYGAKMGGQFFTPRSVQQAVAAMEYEKAWATGNDVIKLYEPTIGSGGMVIEVCNLCRMHDINYQDRLRIIGQDLDWRCIHMSYVQLSLLGANAVIAQGDTLSDPYVPGMQYPRSRLWRTPKNAGVLS